MKYTGSVLTGLALYITGLPAEPTVEYVISSRVAMSVQSCHEIICICGNTFCMCISGECLFSETHSLISMVFDA